ncbi:MAG: hypothetical protein ACFFA4_13685, partial [Promethearchaeota archaeon]
MEKSFEERPERSIDDEVKKFKEYIQERRVKWSEEEKIELETDKFDNDESLINTKSVFIEMPYHIISSEISEYIDDGYKIIGFDESSNVLSGTYAKLASFKFGECQIIFKNGKYHIEKIMYKPISTYIEDNEHKLIIYQTVIENFIKTIKRDFYIKNLKSKVDNLVNWYKSTYQQKIQQHIDAHDFYYPTIGHVIDRIRTADEILKSLIRIKDES